MSNDKEYLAEDHGRMIAKASMMRFFQYEILCGTTIIESNSEGDGHHPFKSLINHSQLSHPSLIDAYLNPHAFRNAGIPGVEFESYDCFARGTIELINSLHMLYKSCLYDERDATIEYLFTILHNACECQRTYDQGERDTFCFLPNDIVDSVRSVLYALERTGDTTLFSQHLVGYFGTMFNLFHDFPLLLSYNEFMDEKSHYYDGKYGSTYRNTNEHLVYKIHFWQNP